MKIPVQVTTPGAMTASRCNAFHLALSLANIAHSRVVAIIPLDHDHEHDELMTPAQRDLPTQLM